MMLDLHGFLLSSDQIVQGMMIMSVCMKDMVQGGVCV